MRCITLWQPHATLMALGAKLIETRNWATDHRGSLAIHAAKTLEGLGDLDLTSPWDEKGARFDPILRTLQAAGYQSHRDLPLGAIVAVVTLRDCLPTETLLERQMVTDKERCFGNYAPQRFGWVSENVRALPAPLPWRGNRKIFDVDGIAVRRALEAR